ncbi:hypothetical protein GOHSU_40_00080 [Gordonia hirsuta DSM 44140 = NBRC 16056]|uniref:GrpE protein n=1 Tax=Gordonia hirsuta DSM 44140 = NBRC 16056 TaxID=1121927 RepID=L7LBX5_9ACTN|nr:hypothetical protein [Gordonia hirsuta]GAC58424.1 hypothetical protein GOHSU_40_00080 [Gordonia hirsuta DSM 44140 = NBRC 16056]
MDLDPVVAALIAVAIALVGMLTGYLLGGRTAPRFPAGSPHAGVPQRPGAPEAFTPDPAPPGPSPAGGVLASQIAVTEPVPVSAPSGTGPLGAGPLGAGPAPVPDGKMVHALIGAYDTSTEASVRGYIADQLGGVGIRAVEPEPGTPFVPDSQRCVATEHLADAPAGTIIRTERPGWRGPNGPVRMPDVTVVAAPDRS